MRPPLSAGFITIFFTSSSSWRAFHSSSVRLLGLEGSVFVVARFVIKLNFEALGRVTNFQGCLN